MYTIGDVSRLTGISAFTLRYYEKIGVLPAPGRKDGKRLYEEEDLRFIRFIHGLKQTGMSLGDIAIFAEEGCILSSDLPGDILATLQKRTTLLEQHIEHLEQQVKQLEEVKKVARTKKNFYETMIQDLKDREKEPLLNK
ncbi:MerR family transcriptional regulator [Paenibacillus zeisoli]|uniref:MerR family transcriptional regulator n=1 Tax=Paenibacillus zeisoli TaxID=2496267 RepID=A0A3S1JS70_9BACL|nr:MerR family transcriptional regulator [Paenibacillus zeisoli]RUT35493.1 MerR family transcriptional regulator [Paenibacillus zeisoli]